MISRWETTSQREAEVSAGAVWQRAYAAVAAWREWNSEIRRVELDGPLAHGARARIVFRTGLRLSFEVIEFQEGHLFTDEARLPGARMGHRHLVEGRDEGACTLVNTIYIEGPLAPLWRRVMGPAAARALPHAQEKIVALARAVRNSSAAGPAP